jgi:hypothetical protein
MKRYYSKLLPKLMPAVNWVKKYYYVVVPVAACLILVLIFRPWSTSASPGGVTSGAHGGAKNVAQGRQLLVGDRAPASANPITYEYIMTEAQQKRVLKEATKLKAGDDVKTVLEKLGPPMKDDSTYGHKNPAEPKKFRALSYYFAKRSMLGGNDFDPCVFVVFDEHGKLFAMASNITEIPEINWGAGVTAYNGVTH